MGPTLGYWDLRGIVTPIRLLLSYAEVPYEFKEYQIEQPDKWFLEEKVQLAKEIDFPNLPYYIDEEVQLTHSKTIIAYLGRKHNLGAASETEEIRMSLAMEQIADMRTLINNVAYPPACIKNRTEVHDTLRKEYLESIPTRLSLFSKFMGNNKWVAGDHLTYADFYVYDVLDFHRLLFNPEHFNAFPSLVAYTERIEALKGVKEYLANMDRMPTHAPGYALFGNSKDYKPSD